MDLPADRKTPKSDKDHRLGHFDSRATWPSVPQGEQPCPSTRREAWSRCAQHADVCTKLRRIIEPDSELMIRHVGEPEPAVTNDSIQCRLGSPKVAVERRIDQPDHAHALPRRRDGDKRPPCPVRLDADQHATGLQASPGSLEGMNHALERDSSKGPAEERNVEERATSVQALRRADMERDIADSLGRACPPGLDDACRVGIDRNHCCGFGRILHGEPAVAAPDLQDAPAAEADEALDQPDLDPLRRVRGDVLSSSHASGRCYRPISQGSSAGVSSHSTLIRFQGERPVPRVRFGLPPGRLAGMSE